MLSRSDRASAGSLRGQLISCTEMTHAHINSATALPYFLVVGRPVNSTVQSQPLPAEIQRATSGRASFPAMRGRSAKCWSGRVSRPHR